MSFGEDTTGMSVEEMKEKFWIADRYGQICQYGEECNNNRCWRKHPGEKVVQPEKGCCGFYFYRDRCDKRSDANGCQFIHIFSKDYIEQMEYKQSLVAEKEKNNGNLTPTAPPNTPVENSPTQNGVQENGVQEKEQNKIDLNEFPALPSIGEEDGNAGGYEAESDSETDAEIQENEAIAELTLEECEKNMKYMVNVSVAELYDKYIQTGHPDDKAELEFAVSLLRKK